MMIHVCCRAQLPSISPSQPQIVGPLQANRPEGCIELCTQNGPVCTRWAGWPLGTGAPAPRVLSSPCSTGEGWFTVTLRFLAGKGGKKMPRLASSSFLESGRVT